MTQSADGSDLVRPAIADHYRVDRRDPAKVVDMAERRASGDQSADDLDMAKMCGSDQRIAIVLIADPESGLAARAAPTRRAG